GDHGEGGTGVSLGVGAGHRYVQLGVRVHALGHLHARVVGHQVDDVVSGVGVRVAAIDGCAGHAGGVVHHARLVGVVLGDVGHPGVGAAGGVPHLPGEVEGARRATGGHPGAGCGCVAVVVLAAGIGRFAGFGVLHQDHPHAHGALPLGVGQLVADEPAVGLPATGGCRYRAPVRAVVQLHIGDRVVAQEPAVAVGLAAGLDRVHGNQVEGIEHGLGHLGGHRG